MAPKKKENSRPEAVVGKSAVKGKEDTVEAENNNGAIVPAPQQGLPKAFERPTQLYRFMRDRHQSHPVFLHRTLTYMRGRMSRSHKLRKSFIINDLYLSKKEPVYETTDKYMTLTFLGYFDKLDTNSDNETVKVEISVWKECHNKRKDHNSSGIKLAIMTIEVPVNPPDDSPHQVPILSISPEAINVESLARTIKSYSLTIRVCRESPLEGQLMIYNSKTCCLMLDGEYEVLVKEPRPKKKKNHRTAWLTKDNFDDDACIMESGPAIKFRLEWTVTPHSGWVDRPKSFNQKITSGDNKENRPTKGKKVPARALRTSGRNPRLGSSSKKASQDETGGSVPDKISTCIEFRFVHTVPQSGSQSVSTTFENFLCPWCFLNCLSLYPLVKHLRIFHYRFNYICSPQTETSGYQITVTLNDTFDGKYEGNPLDLVAPHPAPIFSRGGPVHRTSFTQILVCKPKRPRPSLAEFLETEENADPVELQRTYVSGHSRLYHHTTTNMPVYPREMDQDSEGEKDPKWLRQKTVMMIDDFTDVNEGEKELMKLWNLHVMKWGFVGDCQLPVAHSIFIDANGKSMLTKNLYRNFVLHLCNMYDYNLIAPPLLYKVIMEMQDLMSKDPEAIDIAKTGWEKDRAGWLQSGGSGGSRDKTGKGFLLAVPKSEPTHPRLASSSTFITGDGTLRRKMTQQTPQSVKKEATRPSTSTPNGISQSLLDTNEIKEEPDEEEEGKDEEASRGSTDRGLRKRKLSLQDKLGDEPAKRKRSGSLPVEAGAVASTSLQRRSTAPADAKPVMRKSSSIGSNSRISGTNGQDKKPVMKKTTGYIVR